MSELIQWPTAKYWTAQWNPVIGCKPCSPACENCYAAAWARRFGRSFKPHQSSQERPPRKGVVFCGNMTDLFGEWLWPNKGCCTARSSVDFFRWTTSGISKIGIYKDTTFLWCTKRVDAMCDALGHYAMPRNHYFGFTAENQEWYNKRFRESCNIPSWANWWISAEPLLGPIDLNLTDRHPITGSLGTLPHLPSCIVVGCESGPNRRPCKIEWVESIVDQCRCAGVPVFVKQLDIGGKCVTDINKFPAHLRIRQVPWEMEGGAK